MWPFSRPRREAELLAETLKAITEAAAALARTGEAQAKALEAHLALFKTPEAPKGWVNRDSDEALAEMERLGFPRYGTQEEQLKWVAENTGRDISEYELRPIND